VSDFRIVAVDLEDEEAFRAFYAVHEASQVHDRPDTFVPIGCEKMRDGLLRTPGNQSHELLAAYDGPTAVASGLIALEVGANEHLAWFHLDVHPEHRRRGAGAALLAAMERASVGLGRTALFGTANTLPGQELEETAEHRFALSHGYELAYVEHQRVLDLPVAVDLDALARDAAAHHEGYRIVAFDGRVPEEYVAGYAALEALVIAESPTGDVTIEASDPDPALVREAEDMILRRGQALFGAIALSPAGEVVAMTRMAQRAGDATKLGQWGTLVRSDQRGHRLGLAVKIAVLRLIGPSYVSVGTWNAADNAPMIAVNETLGFHLVELGAGYQKLVG
jgi:GNAT superfamily N-acetyltransferase